MGQNRVFLEADTLLMNLTEGLNSNLEKKNAGDHEIERQAVINRAKANEEKTKKAAKWFVLNLNN